MRHVKAALRLQAARRRVGAAPDVDDCSALPGPAPSANTTRCLKHQALPWRRWILTSNRRRFRYSPLARRHRLTLSKLTREGLMANQNPGGGLLPGLLLALTAAVSQAQTPQPSAQAPQASNGRTPRAESVPRA